MRKRLAANSAASSPGARPYLHHHALLVVRVLGKKKDLHLLLHLLQALLLA